MALEQGEIEILGDNRLRRVDVRLLAATNKTLEQMVAGGRFREGLYHRLNGVQIYLAPLRERRMDIAPSAEYFLNQ